MKRKNENIPGFDDIIFRDRNKEYGAYDLRRRYGSTMSISIVAGLIFGTSLILVPFFASDHTVRQPGDIIEIIAITDNTLLQPPELPVPPTPKPPVEAVNQLRFIPPEVVADIDATGVLPADILNQEIVDREAVEVSVEPVEQEAVTPVEPEPYVFVKEMPSFPGGTEALLKYISDRIVYPEDALANQIQGTVFLRFVVSRTGEVTRVEVTRSVDPLLDNEAVRVVSGLPRWKPGKQDGNPVPVWFALPVTFRVK
ncbi:MAG: energy transducer TonB [Bacteroidales bacterium]|jgi:protein TonB|nr:energy transducer TonB [Bacteroidales bacterium]